jgi:uncharacterized membrane protein YidH (DUF202 family)
VRVATALIALGFAVDRFGLLVAQHGPFGPLVDPWSSWVGLTLIGCGVATSIVSAINYRYFLRGYRAASPGLGIPLAIGLALLLALLGVVMAVYLWQASAPGSVAQRGSGPDAAGGAPRGVFRETAKPEPRSASSRPGASAGHPLAQEHWYSIKSF